MPTKTVKEPGEIEQAPKILDAPIATGATGLRKESDSLGAIEVPADHYQHEGRTCLWILSPRRESREFKVIVFKNDSLAFVELEMKAASVLDFATDLHNPNFARWPKPLAFLALTAETPEQVWPMIIEALDHSGSVSARLYPY